MLLLRLPILPPKDRKRMDFGTIIFLKQWRIMHECLYKMQGIAKYACFYLPRIARKGDDTSLRPTMFDLLAHRTIDFIKINRTI